MSGERPVDRFLAWLADAPDGTLLDVARVREQLRSLLAGGAATKPAIDASWRERLWTAPAETRISVRELAAAMGRSPSWVWRHCGESRDPDPIPHRKRDGELVFLVGEVREWLEQREESAPVDVPRVAGVKAGRAEQGRRVGSRPGSESSRTTRLGRNVAFPPQD